MRKKPISMKKLSLLASEYLGKKWDIESNRELPKNIKIVEAFEISKKRMKKLDSIKKNVLEYLDYVWKNRK